MRIYDFLRDYLIYLALFFMFFAALRNICEFTIFYASSRSLPLFSGIHHKTTIFFANFTLNLPYFFESTLNQLFLQCESSIFLANYVWIHNDSHESLFCVFTILFTIFFAISLKTHNIFREIIILSTVFFLISLFFATSV